MKRLISVILALMLLASCAAFAESAMPISEDGASLSIFVTLDGKASVSLSSLEENLTMQYYEKLSGVDVEWQHPSSANTLGEAVNLLLASGELPDLIFNITYGSENLDTLIENDMILDLTDLIPQYAPNLNALLEEHPEIRSQITTYDGHIGLMPGMRLDEPTRYFESFIIREDWLEKLGLEAPTTTEEWYEVLKAFKTQDPNGNGEDDELPFVANTNEEMGVYRLSALWGFNGCFYKQYATSVRDGQIVFAADAPEFDAWVTEMAKWYAEGLIDPEYVSTDATAWKEKTLTDRTGAFYGKMNGGIGTLLGAYDYEAGDPNFSLTPVPYATCEDGKSYDFFSQDIYDGEGCAISTSCKDVETAMRWVDYLYSPEGQIMASFGVEGETFEFDENGTPDYTSLITEAEGLSLVQGIAKYTLGGIAPRMLNDTYYWNRVMATEQQRRVYPTVSVSTTERKTPQHLTYSQDDAARLTSLMSDIGTYYRENLNAFIMGSRSLDELDDFRKTLHEQMNLDEAIGLMQASYETFLQK